MLGQLLDGRYLVEAELGAGGFGKTYRAKDTRLPGQPICVVKQLQPQSSDPYFLTVASRLFEQEAEVLQKLGKHPRIPTLLAHFEQNKEFFLVQEFIDGGSLTGELSQGRKWSEAEVKKLLGQILNPLAAAHQEKVIHRDIKPDNLMRRKVDSQIFLIDFGAVKQVAATQVNHLKQNTTVGIGTEGYTPIEQTLGKPHLGGSDIYALGIVVLQALTGTSDATNLMDANTAQIQWRHLAKVSSEFGAVLDKMVANAVVNRYQSAMEVIEVLKAISLQSRGNPVKASIGINQPNFTAFIKSKLTIVTKKPKNLQNWLMGIVVGGGLIAVGWFVRPSNEITSVNPDSTKLSVAPETPNKLDSTGNLPAIEETKFPIPTSLPAGIRVRIGGSQSLEGLNKGLQEAFNKQFTNFEFVPTYSSTSKGLAALKRGEVEIVGVDRPLTIEEQVNKGFGIKNLGSEKIAIVVSDKNTFAKDNIDFDQFARVYRGEIQDWSKVGGTKGAIKVIDLTDNNGTRQSFGKYPIFKSGVKTGSNVVKVTDNSAQSVVSKLGSNGIGYLPISQVNGLSRIKVLSLNKIQPDNPNYPFSQPMYYIYIKNNVSAGAKALLGFVDSPEGAAAIAAVPGISR